MTKYQLALKVLLLFTSCILLCLRCYQFLYDDVVVAQPPSPPSKVMDMDKPPKQTKPQSNGSNMSLLPSEEDQETKKRHDRIMPSAADDVEGFEKRSGTEETQSQPTTDMKHPKAKRSKLDATSASDNRKDNSAATKRKRQGISTTKKEKSKATMPIREARNLQASSASKAKPAAETKRFLNEGFSFGFSFSIDLYDIDIDAMLLQEEEEVQGGSSTSTSSSNVKGDADDLSQFFDDILDLHGITTTTSNTEETKKPSRFSITAAPASAATTSQQTLQSSERYIKRPYMEDKVVDRLQATTGRRRRLIKVEN